MGERVKVCGVGDLTPGSGMMAEAGGKQVAVFNVDGEFHAMGGECTHQGGPLGEGELEGSVVTCPWHGARFDVTTGTVKAFPAPTSVESYPVTVEGDEVWVDVP